MRTAVSARDPGFARGHGEAGDGTGALELRRAEAVAIVEVEQGSLAHLATDRPRRLCSGVPAVLDSAFTPLVLPRVGVERTDARAESERARARGYADGFAEGRKAADAEAQQRLTVEAQHAEQREAAAGRALASALDALQHARTQLDTHTVALAELAAARIEQLALQLAETILAAELSDDARSAAHALRRALSELPDATESQVLLHPDDHRTLVATGALAAVPTGVDIAVSPEVDRGGALVMADDGTVDARVAQALARASAALRGDTDAEGHAA